MSKLNWTDIAWLVFFVTSPSICNSHSLHACVCAYVYSTNSTWLVTSRHGSTRSTCRAHAFWLCWACRTALLDMLDTMNSTGSTRWTCQVVSRRDMTSQVEFWLIWGLLWMVCRPWHWQRFLCRCSASDSLCRYDEALCHSLVQHVCKSVGRDLLVRFVICFLLESNLTSVRWQAHSLVLHIYRLASHSYYTDKTTHVTIFMLPLHGGSQ